MSSSRAIRYLHASRQKVYRALVDPSAIARWKVPEGMTCHVHTFEVREGGRFRVSLTYDAPTARGKTTRHTDTYHGRFLELVPNEKVVDVLEFETSDPTLQGRMTTTITLSEDRGGTRLVALHEGLPPGVSPDDNRAGWEMALAKLATLVEDG